MTVDIKENIELKPLNVFPLYYVDKITKQVWKYYLETAIEFFRNLERGNPKIKLMEYVDKTKIIRKWIGYVCNVHLYYKLRLERKETSF